MKKRALRKDFFMEIRKSLPRFLSIFAIVAMGVAFYSGIQASSPDMRVTGDHYFDENKLMDLNVVSTLGLTDEDVCALKQLDGIKDAEAAYMTDVLDGGQESMKVLRVSSIPVKMNLLSVISGAIPQKADECFLDTEYAGANGYQVGDTLILKESEDDEEDQVLKTHSYIITGIGSSPLYISHSRGNTNIGSGEISGFLYVPSSAFDYEVYTQIYLQVDGAEAEIAYTDGYQGLINAAETEVEAIESERCDARYTDIKEEADDKIADARQELEDGKKEADEKLSDARKTIEDGQKKLDDARQELEDGKQELADGKQILEEKKQELADGKQQLADGYTQLADGKAQLAQKEKEFNAAKKKADKELKSGEKQLEEAKTKLNESQKTYEEQKAAFESGYAQYQAGLAQYEEQKATLDASKAQLAQAKSSYEQLNALIDAEMATEEQQAMAAQLQAQIAATEPQLTAAETQLTAVKQTLDETGTQMDTGRKALDEAEAKIENGKAEIAASETKMTSSKEQLLDGEDQIKAGKQKLSDSETQLAAAEQEIRDGEAQIVDAEQTIKENEQKITDGEKELEQNQQKLFDGQQVYLDAQREAFDKIADGEQKIADAEADVADIKMPEWTIQTRDDLTEYTGYGDNADRMRNIGEVFPVLFFLVAALISLTTMTRMVEEERTQIGTLKALGYGKSSIAGKYLLYALLATVGGSIVGVLIGEKILPYIIINAYGIMYLHMHEILIPYNMQFALLASVAAVFCTMVATLSACLKELTASPAVLMRPPAPKQGRRVLLERITILWKHLSFTWKSTIRNLLRYKKRFLMTIIGIGGCMGLLLVGFGLRDSIMDVAILQYQNLQLYDGMVILKDDTTKEDSESVEKKLRDNQDISKAISGYMKKMVLKNGKATQDGYLIVVPDAMSIQEILMFQSRTTGETYELEDSGCILTEKAAKMLDVSEGDTVVLGEVGDEQVPVSHICENYMYHYVYMTETLYQQIYGEEPAYNCIFYRTNDDTYETAKSVGEQIVDQDCVLSISYTGSIEGQLDDMLGSLDIVIVVIIISAGMLAFIVLYNLNNININERKRELATLKVLGFFDGEVSAYVYRENILLTIIGCFLGVFIGIVLHRYIITTVEVDVCMFGRNIYPQSFLYSILITFAFSFLVNVFMHFKLKKIDMVESLKSVE